MDSSNSQKRIKPTYSNADKPSFLMCIKLYDNNIIISRSSEIWFLKNCCSRNSLEKWTEETNSKFRGKQKKFTTITQNPRETFVILAKIFLRLSVFLRIQPFYCLEPEIQRCLKLMSTNDLMAGIFLRNTGHRHYFSTRCQ